MKELPIVKAILTDDNQGLKFMSAVESPAILVNWVKFNDEKPIKMAIQNEEQQIVFAPALIPDLPIYRNHNGREFYLMFDKETIEQIALKFAKDNLLNSIDLNHDGIKLSGVQIYQSFVTNEHTVDNVKAFETLPIGTWFVGAKVDNQDVWQLIKEEKLNGWSIDGLFEFKIDDSLSDNEIEQMIDEVLNSTKN